MRILVTGGSGQLGREICRAAGSGVQAIGLGRGELDITDPESVRRGVDRVEPDVVLNCAAWTDVDGAERDSAAAFRVNADAVADLAAACAEGGVPLLHLSTDYVFGGECPDPYPENASPDPRNVYGASKLAGERLALDSGARLLVVRSSWIFGPLGRNFARAILDASLVRPVLRVVSDQVSRPTGADDLARTLIAIAERVHDQDLPLPGVLHWAGDGPASRLELARAVVATARERLPVRTERIEAVTTEEFGALADRPRWSVLDCGRAQRLGFGTLPWRDAVARMVIAVEAEGGAADSAP